MQMADAASVIGTTRKQLQNWVERCQVPKFRIRWLAHVRRKKGEPAEFTDLDLLRMRLFVVLVDYGATIWEAAEQVDQVWSGFLLPEPADPKDEDHIIARILGVVSVYDRLVCTIIRGEKHIVSAELVSSAKMGTVPIAALIVRPHELFSETLARAKAVREKKVAA